MCETKTNKEASWLYAELKLHISFQVSFVAYLKLSDETWNEMCYLKLFKPIMEGCLFETFRWDLKWDVLFENFETFQTYHGGLLIWNSQMRLEMRCTVWTFWNFSNLSWRVAYLKLSDETWNEMCYLKLLKLETFQTIPPITGVAYLKLSDETWIRYVIWNFLKLETFQPITRVAYLKLSDEIWNEICYLKHLKCLKLETV